MWNYLAYIIRPNGKNPLNNDSDYEYIADRISRHAKEYNRADWQYIATQGKEGTRPERGPSVAFPWAGQAIFRSSWKADALWSFFDFGPTGTAHRHYDKNHLSIHAYGRDLLVDSGRYSYVGDKWRNYFTGTQSHNTLLVDGKAQKVMGPLTENAMTDQFAITDNYAYARGHYDHGYVGLDGEATHTRAVAFIDNTFWIVVDRVETNQPRDITALWHFHPDNKVAVSGNKDIFTQNEQGNLRLVSATPEAWKMCLVEGQEKGQEKGGIQGWYSVKYNSKVPSPTMVCETKIEKSTNWAWLIMPGEKDPVAATITITESKDNKVVCEVSIDNGPAIHYRIPLSGDYSIGIHTAKK